MGSTTLGLSSLIPGFAGVPSPNVLPVLSSRTFLYGFDVQAAAECIITSLQRAKGK